MFAHVTPTGLRAPAGPPLKGGRRRRLTATTTSERPV